MEENKIIITKILNKPSNQIFQAFTNAEILKQWYSPEGVSVTEAIVDFRVGGTYKIHMQEGEVDYIVIGEYREIIPSTTVIYTWRWVEEDVKNHTLVTVHCKDIENNQTELTLTHEGFPNQETAENHKIAWESMLTKLMQLSK